jgi:hypothetical protein
MYLIFALMGVLLWSSVTKFAGSPALWTLEFAQFIMVGYYLLGGRLFDADGRSCAHGPGLFDVVAAA